MKRMLVIAAAVLTLAGCSTYNPQSGTVHDVRHNESYTMLVCSWWDKGICRVYTPQTVPESWDLDIYNGDDHGWVEVEQNVYNSCHIGYAYIKNKGC